MKILSLSDLEGRTSKDVILHLAHQYSGDVSGFDYGDIGEKEIKKAKEQLKDLRVLIAYESVGDYGCDSSSFFLLQNKLTNVYYEVHGGHCSCYGFEGQMQLEETTAQALKARAKDGGLFYCGGYEDDGDNIQRKVKEYVNKL